MENKYYRPALEEFHVGFEYEIWTKVLVRDDFWGFKVNKYMFTEKYLTQAFFHHNLFLDLQEDKIRVKCFDQSDIESFGWKQEFDMTAYILNSDSGGFQLYDEYDDSEGKGKYITIYDKEGNADVIFKGYIKNKSEFRRLMKQLNITK